MCPLLLLAYRSSCCPICRIWVAHLTAFAWARARESAGSRMAINNAIMPITTSSSTSVNPRRPEGETLRIGNTPQPLRRQTLQLGEVLNERTIYRVHRHCVQQSL